MTTTPILITRSTPLNDALQRLGMRTEPASAAEYPRRRLMCGDQSILVGTDTEIWRWLRATNQIEEVSRYGV